MTANVRYVLDAEARQRRLPRPQGRQDRRRARAKARTNADWRALSISFKAPKDFGGIHDIYAVVDGVQVAKGGFLLERAVTICAEAGPGRHADHRHGRGHGLADVRERRRRALRQPVRGRRLGQHDARRLVSFKIRAAGEVGPHWIEYGGSSHTVPYLNMEQSPVPWTDGHRLKFTVTKDVGRSRPERRSGRPTSSRPSTRGRLLLDGEPRPGLDGGGRSSPRRGSDPLEGRPSRPPGSPRTRPSTLLWSTVVGQPRELHGPVLELRAPCRSARQRPRRTARSRRACHDPRRPRRLARGPAHAGRQGHGPGAVLREAELRERRRKS